MLISAEVVREINNDDKKKQILQAFFQEIVRKNSTAQTFHKYKQTSKMDCEITLIPTQMIFPFYKDMKQSLLYSFWIALFT
jgi:hypothetical protein